MRRKSALHWVLAGCVVALGCGPSSTPGEGDLDGGGKPTIDDAGNIIPRNVDAPEEEEYVDAGPPQPNWDAFVLDPPPMYCGPDGGAVNITPPTGSVGCPDDKNNEGCECFVPGKKAPCWPGYRVDRNRGICQDGETECVPYDDVTASWGPCKGAVLPVEGATSGKEACNCFSQGEWQLDNLLLCLQGWGTTTGVKWYAVSSYGAGAAARCPSQPSMAPPKPEPGQPFSTNRLSVDCMGQFKLCLTIRAGSIDNPQPTDCQIVEVCTEGWVPNSLQPGEYVEFPPLPAWTSTNTSCVDKFVNADKSKPPGYSEMSVIGTSGECEAIDDGSGKPYVFNRIAFCPWKCSEAPCDKWIDDKCYSPDPCYRPPNDPQQPQLSDQECQTLKDFCNTNRSYCEDCTTCGLQGSSGSFGN